MVESITSAHASARNKTPEKPTQTSEEKRTVTHVFRDNTSLANKGPAELAIALLNLQFGGPR